MAGAAHGDLTADETCGHPRMPWREGLHPAAQMMVL
jgi:hypothetical protein